MFDLVTNADAPTATTVASYELFRLGETPQLRVRYVETNDAGVNVFGIEAQKEASGGRSWELLLNSGKEAQRGVMAQVLGAVGFTLVKEALAALAITDVTDDQLVAALGTIESVDSVIATQLEDLEKARRAGTLPDVRIIGNAPTA